MFKTQVNEPAKLGSLAFHVAANNRELLMKIHELMAGNGYIGMKDGIGRYHYLIDGRKGAPLAVKRIRERAQEVLQQEITADVCRELNAEFYIDAVLGCYLFDQSLRGYTLLRFALILTTTQPELMKSMSKDLYPAVARAYSVSVSQVERNMRYCLEKLKANELSWHEEQNHRCMPLIFRNGLPAYQPTKPRVLLEGKERYSNSCAIRELNFQIQQMIRRDHRELQSFTNPLAGKSDPRS